MFKNLIIRYEFLGGNILAESADDTGTFDEAASVARYAELCEAALKATFPGAAIQIDYELMASGGSGDTVTVTDTSDQYADYHPGDSGELGRLAARVQELVGKVWERWEWPVYTSRAEAIVAALNAYQAANADPRTSNIWGDVITGLAEYDEDATMDADASGASDVVVLTDGTRVVYDHQSKEWRVD